ncbi:hypothetical protein DF186_21395 [Enterococcus hirae]|nr:hypothetical protein DF186_21395 [Enterococcus hirae]
MELICICNYMLNLGLYVMDVGVMMLNLWLFEICEDCFNFFECVLGVCMYLVYFWLGGVY